MIILFDFFLPHLPTLFFVDEIQDARLQIVERFIVHNAAIFGRKIAGVNSELFEAVADGTLRMGQSFAVRPELNRRAKYPLQCLNGFGSIGERVRVAWFGLSGAVKPNQAVVTSTFDHFLDCRTREGIGSSDQCQDLNVVTKAT